MPVIQRGTEPAIVEEKTTEELLREILVELKINNAQLAAVTGDEVNEEDLEDDGD